jgi:hypothetical protein
LLAPCGFCQFWDPSSLGFGFGNDGGPEAWT